MNQKQHYLQLDGVRALAVTMVMVHHFAPSTLSLHLGSLGVRLFFALSGFLITGIILGCKRDAERGLLTSGFGLRQFYIRRFLRIFPAYYLLIAIAVIFHLGSITAGLPWHIFYLSNFYMAAKGTFIGPATILWSLSVEEQFYLFWPALLMFIPRKWEVPAVWMLIAVAPISRTVAYAMGANEFSIYVLLTSSLDCLGLGAWLAITGKDSVLWKLLPLGIVGAVICRLLGGTGISIIGESFFDGLLSAWLVAWARAGIPGIFGRLLQWKPVRYVGTISYGIYLCHSFVGEAVNRLHLYAPPGLQEAMHFAMSATLSVGVASISWFCYERPINALKDRFPYRARKPAEADVVPDKT